ncbi:MAG: TonB-dependent receptor [Bacteroidetes bacterium]|nr:TonB-dependent receptor [Bacteroidota bacterium]
MKRFQRWRIVAAAGLFCQAIMWASTPIDTVRTQQGSIAGVVVDKESKQPIPNVSVQILGTTIGTATDMEGRYSIKNIGEDVYKLKLSSLGYSQHIETNVRVVRNKTTVVRELALDEQLVTGDGVEVTASLFSSDNVSPVTNYHYSLEEIRRSPGSAGDIFRAIETLPGVASSGGEFSAFSVRGGSPRDNIIIVDNIPFDKVSHFDGGTEEQEAQGGRFSIFTPGVIDEANFQAGGFSARYGGKNASFVDLKIKEGNRESATMNGTYDVLGWEVNYDGPVYLHDKTSLLFSARHQDFTTILDMTGQSDLGYPSFTDVLLKSTTELDAGNKISLLAIYSPEFFERTINNVYEIEGTDYDNQLARSTDTKYLLGLNWRTLTGRTSVLENSVYYRGNSAEFRRSNSYVYPVNGVVPKKDEAYVRKDYYRYDSEEDEVGIRSQFTYTPSVVSSVTFGIQANRTSFDYSARQIDPETLFVFGPNDYRPDPAKKFIVLDPMFINSVQKATKAAGAVFAEYTYSPTEALMFIPSVRYEYSGFNERSYISPRVSASYFINERVKISAATGLYYQPVELRTISLDVRNALLDHERAVHYIAGITAYLTDDVKLTAEVYHKDLSDLIVKTDRTSDLRKNTGTGHARGIDLGLVKKFVGHWYGQLNYSYSSSLRDNRDGLGEYRSDFDQPHIFNILFGYEFDSEWSFSTKWKYATGRPKDSYTIHANVFNDPAMMRYSKEIVGNNTDRLPDFHTWNIRIDYRKQLGSTAIVAFLDILNLYNRLNVNEERFIETTGTIDPKGFQILPSFGVKLEF